MPTQTLGKVKLTPRGAYDPAATYVPLDIVSYGGGSYCVLKNVTGVTPTGDDVNYQLLAESGTDGKSPQISASKTWLVWDADAGEYVDTGVSAAGAKGEDGDPGKAPIIGSNGNWYVWDDASGAYADTGKPSRGEKGAIGAAGADGADGKDGANGITPTIGENGNWYLGATDTGKPSRGADGAAGATGATGEKGADGKSAYAYAVQGGYTGTETEFTAKLAEEFPEKLPNPNALTFTGAVTGSYDGSAPVSVEIPSGGGSSGGSTAEWQLLGTYTMLVSDRSLVIDLSQFEGITHFRIIGNCPKCSEDCGALYLYLGTALNHVQSQNKQNTYALRFLGECELFDGQLYGFLGTTDGWATKLPASVVAGTPRDSGKCTSFKIYYGTAVNDTTENTIQIWGY